LNIKSIYLTKFYKLNKYRKREERSGRAEKSEKFHQGTKEPEPVGYFRANPPVREKEEAAFGAYTPGRGKRTEVLPRVYSRKIKEKK